MKYMKEYLYPLFLAVLSIVSILIVVIFCILKMQKNAFFEGLSIILIIAAFLLAIVALIYGFTVIIKDVKNKNYILKRLAANIIAILLASIILFIFFLGIVILYRPD